MIMLMLAGPAVLICKETVIRSLSLHLRHLNRKDINMDNTVKNRQCSDGANNYGSNHCKPNRYANAVKETKPLMTPMRYLAGQVAEWYQDNKKSSKKKKK